MLVGIVIVLDLLLGIFVSYTLKNYNSSSGIFRIATTLENYESPKLIFIGNSRIVNNINPNALENQDIINLGFYETGLKFWYIYLKAAADLNLKNKYILDLADGEFIGEKYPDKNIKKYLVPNLRNHKIETKELDSNFLEKFFYQTNMFTYRSIIPRLLDAILREKSFNGYVDTGIAPICEVGLKCKNSPNESKLIKPDYIVENHLYLNKIINLINERNLDVTFIVTPIHSQSILLAKYKEESLIMAISYLKKKGFTVLDYSQSKNYRKKDDLFFDLYHLNRLGAQIFTKEVVNNVLELSI